MGDKKKRNCILAAIGYSIVYLGILIYGIGFLTPGDEMGYTILDFYILLPMVSIITGIVVGLNGKKLKWIVPIITALLGFLLPVLVFKSYYFDATCLFFSGIPSLLGIIIAIIIRGK